MAKTFKCNPSALAIRVIRVKFYLVSCLPNLPTLATYNFSFCKSGCTVGFEISMLDSEHILSFGTGNLGRLAFVNQGAPLVLRSSCRIVNIF